MKELIKDEEIQKAVVNLSEIYKYFTTNADTFNSEEEAMSCFKEQLLILKSHIANPYE